MSLPSFIASSSLLLGGILSGHPLGLAFALSWLLIGVIIARMVLGPMRGGASARRNIPADRPYWQGMTAIRRTTAATARATARTTRPISENGLIPTHSPNGIVEVTPAMAIVTPSTSQRGRVINPVSSDAGGDRKVAPYRMAAGARSMTPLQRAIVESTAGMLASPTLDARSAVPVSIPFRCHRCGFATTCSETMVNHRALHNLFRNSR